MLKAISQCLIQQPALSVIVFFSLFSFFGPVPEADAQASQSASCSVKINEDNCNKAVSKECGKYKKGTSKHTTCSSKTIGRFKNSPAAGRPGQDGDYICGTYSGDNAGRNVHTKFDFGCLGTAYEKNPGSFPGGSKNLSPILDFTYAIIRFLSIGVGIAITMALIASGIQYSASEGSAEVSTKAKKRVESAITGLLIYIFSYALLQFLIPGGVFK